MIGVRIHAKVHRNLTLQAKNEEPKVAQLSEFSAKSKYRIETKDGVDPADALNRVHLYFFENFQGKLIVFTYLKGLFLLN